VTAAELAADLERRAGEAEAVGATAPLGAVLRQVAAEVAALDGAPRLTLTTGSGAVWLTVAEAADRLHVAPRWVYRHARSLPWVRRLGPKTLRVDPEGLARWAAKRPA
jgi:helix-turn-helix protein